MQILTNMFRNIYLNKYHFDIDDIISIFEEYVNSRPLSLKKNCYCSANFNTYTGNKNKSDNKNLKIVEDLYKAYQYAKKNILSKNNLFYCHKLLSLNILPENKQGVIRTVPAGLKIKKRISFPFISPRYLLKELHLFFFHIEELNKRKLTMDEIFFYASVIHLVFVTLHPFYDGNGRLGRLLEKWFIVAKLEDEKYWHLPTEEYYRVNKSEYYSRLEIAQTNLKNSIGFIRMLPNSILHLQNEQASY